MLDSPLVDLGLTQYMVDHVKHYPLVKIWDEM